MKNPLLILKITALVLFAATTADILTDLSIPQARLEEVAMKTAQKGLQVPEWNRFSLRDFVNKAKALPAGSQAAAVKSLGAVVKAYISSERFKKEWQAYVAGLNVRDPRADGEYERLAEAKKKAASQQAEAEKASVQMNESQKQMSKMLKENPQMMETFKSQMSKEEWAEMQSYLTGETKMPVGNAGDNSTIQKVEAELREAQLRYDNTRYPTMVKNRLKKLIETANSVDFAAQTKADKYGTKKFVNPAYEKKSDLWKQLYRAGKEPAMAARDFAQQWLGEVK